jgi:hypothetical protein
MHTETVKIIEALIQYSPAILAGIAAGLSFINRRILKSSHEILNQRFTDLENANKSLRSQLREYEDRALTVSAQAAVILEAAIKARDLIRQEAKEAKGSKP